jgi:hypothetical protein
LITAAALLLLLSVSVELKFAIVVRVIASTVNYGFD